MLPVTETGLWPYHPNTESSFENLNKWQIEDIKVGRYSALLCTIKREPNVKQVGMRKHAYKCYLTVMNAI